MRRSSWENRRQPHICEGTRQPHSKWGDFMGIFKFMLWKRRKSDVTYLEMSVHMDIFVQHLNLVNHTVNECVGYCWCGLWRPVLLQNFTGTNSYGELMPANYCMGGSSLSGKHPDKGILIHFLMSPCRGGTSLGLRTLHVPHWGRMWAAEIMAE